MILEKDYGKVQIRGEEWSLRSSLHTHQKRAGDFKPRNTLSKGKLQKILDVDFSEFNLNQKIVLTWKESSGKYKGLLLAVDPDKMEIFIVSSILSGNNKPERIFKKETQRLNIDVI